MRAFFPDSLFVWCFLVSPAPGVASCHSRPVIFTSCCCSFSTPLIQNSYIYLCNKIHKHKQRSIERQEKDSLRDACSMEDGDVEGKSVPGYVRREQNSPTASSIIDDDAVWVFFSPSDTSEKEIERTHNCREGCIRKKKHFAFSSPCDGRRISKKREKDITSSFLQLVLHFPSQFAMISGMWKWMQGASKLCCQMDGLQSKEEKGVCGVQRQQERETLEELEEHWK